ncbi:MAG: ribosome maturation factor RimP [Desulfobulbaceae bacterium]|nr:ribosome maturation factor RimP [Desulfobulbaceae bacterium]MCK5341369.1 ribosome maturation factor RimP [Desulfobulbaceae bacterium]
MKELSHAGQSTLLERLSERIEPICIDCGLELVEVQFRRESSGQVLRVIIDGPAGIGIDDCARVSRELSYLFDVEDIIEQAYHLEVSSPGLDRPLKNERDFARNKGRKVEITMHEKSEPVKGIVKGFEGEHVVLETDDDEIRIPLEQIITAKLVIDF